MKSSGKYALFGFVAFLAVLGALQANRWINRQTASNTITDVLERVPMASVASGGASGPSDFRDAVAKIAPAVVSVDRFDQVVDFFGDVRGEQQTGTGSGVIISEDGYVLTNNHVVADAGRVIIRLKDDRTLNAKVVGTDPRSDLAVLKVDAKNLTSAVLADSSKVQVGEWAIAIGNPLGYSNTVSVGVISNLNRNMQTGRTSILVELIQTDAAINQGNSGGALANAKGELIGINSAIATNSGGSIGLGFAIPVNRAKKVVADIIKFGRVQYGSLGVMVVERAGLLQNENVRQQIEDMTGSEPPNDGLIVRASSPGSAGESLGLKEPDVLIKVDSILLKSPIDLTKALIDKRPGDKVRLTYWSRGATKTVEVQLKEPAQSF